MIRIRRHESGEYMRKTKIYLDTSVISHLEAPDTPDKMRDTQAMWEEIKQGAYDAVISDVTFRELADCPEAKQRIITAYIDEIEYIGLGLSREAEDLAAAYIAHGVLTPKSYDDCLHLALATVSNCDVVVSWNFKHMVRYKTIEGVRNTNAANGYYKNIDIIQPTILLKEEE